MRPWTFVTNHAAVLGYLAGDPNATARQAADAVGITERAIRKIVADLQAAGYISKTRQGRRSVYQVNASLRLRHVAYQDKAVGDLLKALGVRPQRPSSVPTPLRTVSRLTAHGATLMPAGYRGGKRRAGSDGP